MTGKTTMRALIAVPALWVGATALFFALIGVAGLTGSIAGVGILLATLAYVLWRAPGLSIAMCCDTVVAADDARFAAGFGKIGLVADLGLLHTLPARIGQGRARQVFLYGEQIAAARAEAIGMIDRVVPPGTALRAALERAALFHAAAPLPLAMTKQFLAAGLDAMLEWERDTQSTLFLTADHAEGRAAFLGKRPPIFRGV